MSLASLLGCGPAAPSACLTAVGAILTTVLAGSALLGTPRSEYAGVSLFFGALVVMAPFLFAVMQCAARKTTGEKNTDYQGYFWTATLASVMTLWAVIGQLLTLSVLVRQFAGENVGGGLAGTSTGSVTGPVISWGTYGSWGAGRRDSHARRLVPALARA